MKVQWSLTTELPGNSQQHILLLTTRVWVRVEDFLSGPGRRSPARAVSLCGWGSLSLSCMLIGLKEGMGKREHKKEGTAKFITYPIEIAVLPV